MQSCKIRLCRAFLEKRRWIRLRTFIAIELEEETKAQLAEGQAEAALPQGELYTEGELSSDAAFSGRGAGGGSGLSA